jgi:hypothetical protein
LLPLPLAVCVTVQDCEEPVVTLSFAVLLGPFWTTVGHVGPAAGAETERTTRFTVPTCTTRVERVHVQPFPGQLGPA